MSQFAKDLHEWLTAQGVHCGWMRFRQLLDKHAREAGIDQAELTIRHPVTLKLIHELRQ